MQPRDARPVVGFDAYSVCRDGHVWRVKPYPSMGSRKLPYKLRAAKNSSGYLTVVLVDGDRRKTFKVHRLVAAAFFSAPRPEQTDVAHQDGNKTNNAVCNLRWATRTENEADKLKHGTRLRGHRHAQSKLSKQDAERIWSLLAGSGRSRQSIADEFGVSASLVSAIAQGRAWPHLRETINA